MRTYILLSLALVAFVAVVQAKAEPERCKCLITRKLSEVRDFFRSDPLGQRLVAPGRDLTAICQKLHLKIHEVLKKYVKDLLEEEEEEDDSK
uniref:Antigen B subunit 4 n=1 Tax=Echinococcus canadensis TaxID=519352 RepID=Q6Q0G2_9CEST|nr:antigen B subunit 4 [Echinococcus canadensis]